MNDIIALISALLIIGFVTGLNVYCTARILSAKNSPLEEAEKGN